MKKEEIVEIEETTEMETVEEVKESKLKEFTSKAGGFIKKHGKKIAAGAVVGTVALVSFALGKRSEGSMEVYDFTDEDVDIIDIDEEDYSETESTEE